MAHLTESGSRASNLNFKNNRSVLYYQNGLLVKPGTAEHRSTGTRNTRTPEQQNSGTPEQQKFLIWYKF